MGIIILKNPAEAGLSWKSFHVITFNNQNQGIYLKIEKFYYDHTTVFDRIIKSHRFALFKFKPFNLSIKLFNLNIIKLLSLFYNFDTFNIYYFLNKVTNKNNDIFGEKFLFCILIRRYNYKNKIFITKIFYKNKLFCTCSLNFVNFRVLPIGCLNGGSNLQDISFQLKSRFVSTIPGFTNL